MKRLVFIVFMAVVSDSLCSGVTNNSASECPVECPCVDCIYSSTIQVSCPINSTTRFMRSTELSDCVCVPGFFGNWSFGCVECVGAEYCPFNSTVPQLCPVGYECTPSLATPLPGVWRGNGSVFELCPGGFVCSRSWDIEPVPCVGGTYCVNGSDTPVVCPSRSWCGNVSIFPEECPASYFCPLGSPMPLECPAGSFCVAAVDQPVSCLPGFYSAAGASMPMICPPGKLCNETMMSIPYTCPLGFFCIEGSAEPALCIDGYVCLENTSDPALCPAGYFCVSGVPLPAVCPSGQRCPVGTSFPVPCDGGFYCEEGSSVQTICPAAAYCNLQSGNFTPCPVTYFCPEGSPLPMPCPAASVCPFMSAYYEPCPAGSFCYLGIETVCPVGFFCMANVSSPTRCAPGVLCFDGSKDESVECPGGMTCNGPNIEPCAAGLFCVPGSFEGQTCTEGSFCSAGLSEPIPCDPGVLCPAGSVNNMNLCPAGMVCLNGVASPCPSGFFCPMGSYAGVVCTAGGFCAEGSPSPAACPSAAYCPEGVSVPVPCPAGSYCESEAIDPVQCPEFFYCPFETATPHPCPLGRVCPAGSSSTDNACPDGMICAGGMVAGPCPMTYFCVQGDIEVCPGGFVCAEGTSVPVACAAGTYCVDGSFEPAPCLENYYCAAQSDSMLPCPDGAICPATTVRPCYRVPAHSENLTRVCSWDCSSGYASNADNTDCLQNNATSFATLLDVTIGAVNLTSSILHNITKQIEEKSKCDGGTLCQVLVLSITESNGTVIICDKGVCPGYEFIADVTVQVANSSKAKLKNTTAFMYTATSAPWSTLSGLVGTTFAVVSSDTNTSGSESVTMREFNVSASQLATSVIEGIANVTHHRLTTEVFESIETATSRQLTPLVVNDTTTAAAINETYPSGVQVMDEDQAPPTSDAGMDEITSVPSGVQVMDEGQAPQTSDDFIDEVTSAPSGVQVMDEGRARQTSGAVMEEEVTSTDLGDFEQRTTSDAESEILEPGFGRKLLQVSVAPIVSVGVISTVPVLENVTFEIVIAGVPLSYTASFNIEVENTVLADTKVLQITVKEVIQAMKEASAPAPSGASMSFMVVLVACLAGALVAIVIILCCVARRLHSTSREMRTLHSMVEQGRGGGVFVGEGSEMPAMTPSMIFVRITNPFASRVVVPPQIKTR